MGEPKILTGYGLVKALEDCGLTITDSFLTPTFLPFFRERSRKKAAHALETAMAERETEPPPDSFRFLLVDNSPGFIDPGQGHRAVWGNKERGYKLIESGLAVSPATPIVIADGDTYRGAMKEWLAFSGQIAVEASSGVDEARKIIDQSTSGGRKFDALILGYMIKDEHGVARVEAATELLTYARLNSPSTRPIVTVPTREIAGSPEGLTDLLRGNVFVMQKPFGKI